MNQKIKYKDYNKIKKICTHEAGHYVVARELKFKTHGIEVYFENNGNHKGQSILEPRTPGIKSIVNLELYLERRIIVLFAGAIAEKMNIRGDFNPDEAIKEWNNGGSMNDHAKIRELVHILRNIKFPDTVNENMAQSELTHFDRILNYKAYEIVQDRIELIFELGDLIFQKIKFYNTWYELSDSEINNVENIKILYNSFTG